MIPVVKLFKLFGKPGHAVQTFLKKGCGTRDPASHVALGSIEPSSSILYFFKLPCHSVPTLKEKTD